MAQAPEGIEQIIDHTQTVVNVLSTLGVNYADMVNISHLLAALAAERLEVSDEAMVQALEANLPLMRTLWSANENLTPEQASKLKEMLKPQGGSRIIVP